MNDDECNGKLHGASIYRRSASIYDDLSGAVKDYKSDARRIHSIIQDANQGASSLLDVACGTGRHLEVLLHWYEVTGIDSSSEMLDVAGARLPSTTLKQADMVDFRLKERFDAIICMFSSIGYVMQLDRLRRAIANFGQHLNSGGVLVIEPWIAPEDYEEGRISAETISDDPQRQVCKMIVSRRKGRISILDVHRLIGTPFGFDYFVGTHTLGLFSAEEYKLMLEGAGFKVEHDKEGPMGRGLYVGVRQSRRV